MRDLNYWQYTGWFFLVYSGLSALIFGVLTGLDIDGNMGSSMASLMGAAAFTISKIIKDHQRQLSKKEALLLAGYSLIATWLSATVLITLYMLVTEGFYGVYATFVLIISFSANLPMLMIVVATTAIVFLALWGFYGLMNKSLYRAMQKQAEAQQKKQKQKTSEPNL